MDIPGIKPRTNNSENIFIEKGQEVVFGRSLENEKRLTVGLTKKIPSHEEHLTDFSVNDGQFAFDVVSFGDEYIMGSFVSRLLPVLLGLSYLIKNNIPKKIIAELNIKETF